MVRGQINQAVNEENEVDITYEEVILLEISQLPYTEQMQIDDGNNGLYSALRQ